MTASSTWAVQMFEVAFSRRMCCSRVWSASRWAGSPDVVQRGAHEAARQRPAVPVRHGHEAGVWSAETHRDPEPLGRTDHHVHVVVAGRRDQAAGEQVRGHRDAHASPSAVGVTAGPRSLNPSR